MIDAGLASFLQEGLGIYVGTRNAALEPNGARATAVVVDADGAHVTVYITAIAAARLVPDLRHNGQIAVSFGRPTDDRACQVKGVVLEVRDAREDERVTIERQWNALLDTLERIGIPRAATGGWTTWPAMAVRFKQTAVFEQTPGPNAGKPA